MPGFLSRFRRGPEDAPPPQAAPDAPVFKGEVAAIEPVFDASPDGSLPDKLSGPDLDAEGNDVAIESLELAHDALELEPGDSAGMTKAELINDIASPPPADTPTGPIADVLYSAAGNSVEDARDTKFTLFQPDGTPIRAASDQDNSGDGGEVLTEGGEDTDPEAFEPWPVKWKGFSLDAEGSDEPPAPVESLGGATDSDDAGIAIEKIEIVVEKVERVPGDAPSASDPHGYSTLEPLNESKELTGSITFLGSDNVKELFDTDDDPDPDDLT